MSLRRSNASDFDRYSKGDSWNMDPFGRAGFLTKEEISHWERNLLGPLPKDMLQRAHHTLTRGVLYCSDFSGYDAPRECLRLLTQHLDSVWPNALEKLWFKAVRSCDWGKQQQRMLMKQSAVLDQGQCCVFGDIVDRPPTFAREWLQTMKPAKGLDAAASALKNKEISHYLSQHGKLLLGKKSTSFCLMHKKNCPVFPRFHVPHESQDHVLFP